jgi:hypothetical protein
MPTHFSVHSKFRGGGFDACKREDGVRAGASFSPSYASNDSFFLRTVESIILIKFIPTKCF